MTPEPADLLIVGGTVLTMDVRRRVLDDGAVAIRGNHIAEVGPASNLRSRYQAAETVDATGMAVLPGLIDAHGHSGHCLAKGIAEHLSLAEWNRVLERMYSHSTTPEFWLAEARLAALERLKFGVTTGVSMVGASPRCDDPVYASATARGYAELGTRVVVAVGTPGGPWPHRYTSLRSSQPFPVNVTFDQAIETAAAAMRDLHGKADGRIMVYPSASVVMPSFGAGPVDPAHPPKAQQIDHDQADALLRLAEEYDTGIHAHGFGGMFRSAHDGGVNCLGPRYSVAHCTGITEEEVRIIAETGTNVVHGPLTRRYVDEGCPVVELLEAGANVVFGTDGTAPDRSFDLLEKARFGMWLHRARLRDPSVIPPGKALEMVTVDAARALRLPELGALEAGKLADVAIVDLRKPHLSPIAMVPQRLAYLASGQDVHTVVVNGKVVMRDGKVLTADEASVVRDAGGAMWETVDRAGVREHMGIPDGFWGSVRY